MESCEEIKSHHIDTKYTQKIPLTRKTDLAKQMITVCDEELRLGVDIPTLQAVEKPPGMTVFHHVWCHDLELC